MNNLKDHICAFVSAVDQMRAIDEHRLQPAQCHRSELRINNRRVSHRVVQMDLAPNITSTAAVKISHYAVQLALQALTTCIAIMLRHLCIYIAYIALR